MMFLLLALACNPKSDEDCIVYYDKCNSGCTPQCGSLQEEAAVNRGGTCDIGCMDTGTPTDEECVLRDGECTWLIGLAD